MAFGGGVITKHSNDMAVYVCACVCVGIAECNT